MEVLGFIGGPDDMLEFEKLFAGGKSFGIDDIIISERFTFGKL